MVQCLLAAMILRHCAGSLQGLWKDRDAKQAQRQKINGGKAGAS
jgi:hypothetical protein